MLSLWLLQHHLSLCYVGHQVIRRITLAGQYLVDGAHMNTEKNVICFKASNAIRHACFVLLSCYSIWLFLCFPCAVQKRLSVCEHPCELSHSPFHWLAELAPVNFSGMYFFFKTQLESKNVFQMITYSNCVLLTEQDWSWYTNTPIILHYFWHCDNKGARLWCTAVTIIFSATFS